MHIGDSTNLLLGFCAVWDGESPLQSTPVQPLTTYPVEIEPDGTAEWSPPEVTLHDNAIDLAAGLFDYRVASVAHEPGECSVSAGILFLGGGDEASVLSKLGAYLGVDLKYDRGYLLVKMKKVVGWASHEVLSWPRRSAFDRLRHVTAAGRRAEVRLRPGRRDRERRDTEITGREAQGYLEYFRQCGTHFVSKVEAGDALLQVFSYDRKRYQSMLQDWRASGGERRRRGERALNCMYYTSREWVSEVGSIISRSRDRVLAETLGEGIWRNDRNAGTDSILAGVARAGGHSRLMNRFRGKSLLGFELTPLHRFMEFFRAIAAQRVLTACLIQRYGLGVEVSIPLRDQPVDEADAFLRRRWWTIDNPPPASFYRERIDSKVLNQLPSDAEVAVLTGQILELAPGREVELPQKRVTLAVRRIRCPGGAVRKAATLILSERSCPEFTLVASQMTGLLRVASRTGERHLTILDGLVVKDAAPTQKDRGLEIDDIRTLPEGSLNEAGPGLATSLLSCRRLLRLGAAVDEARHHCRWLLEIIPPEDDRLAAIRKVAASLLEEREDAAAAASGRAGETRRRIAAVLESAEVAEDEFRRFQASREGGADAARSLDRLLERIETIRAQIATQMGLGIQWRAVDLPRLWAGRADRAQKALTEIELLRDEALLVASALDARKLPGERAVPPENRAPRTKEG